MVVTTTATTNMNDGDENGVATTAGDAGAAEDAVGDQLLFLKVSGDNTRRRRRVVGLVDFAQARLGPSFVLSCFLHQPKTLLTHPFIHPC